MALKELFDLSGKVALITGGSRGLGLQMAEALGEYGATVVLTARKQNELDEAKAHLESLGVKAHVYANDLGNFEPRPARRADPPGSRPHRHPHQQRRGHLGRAHRRTPLRRLDEGDERQRQRHVLLTQSVLRHCMLPAGKGRIINVASVAGLKQLAADDADDGLQHLQGRGGQLHPCPGVRTGAQGITVNSICPGYFPTKMTRGTLAAAEQQIMSHTPMGRLGGEQDLKGLALLLASDASAYMTGQNIAVDGGITAV